MVGKVIEIHISLEMTDETSISNITKAAEVGQLLLHANCEYHSNQLYLEDGLTALKTFFSLLSQTDQKDNGSREGLIRETIKLFQLIHSEGVDPIDDLIR